MRSRFFAVVGLTLALVSAGNGRAETVSIVSGQGPVGSQDLNTKFLRGAYSGDFPPLTSAQFAAASTGTNAYVVNPYPTYVAPFGGAQYISTTPTGTTTSGFGGLYAYSFNLSQPVGSATLNLNFAVDNQLGSSANAGIFINGTAVVPGGLGTYTSITDVTSSTIGSLLHVGLNTIYFDVVNIDFESSVIFSGTITTSPVPEPASLAMAGFAALAGLGCVAARRRRS